MGAQYPLSGPVDNNGNCTLEFANNIPGIRQEIRQISAWTGIISPLGTVSVSKNGFLVAPSGTLLPIQNNQQGTAAGGLPYLDVYQGEIVTITFQGCTPGDTAYANVMYEEYYSGSQVPIGP